MLDPRRFKVTKIVLFAVLLALVLAFVGVLIGGGPGPGSPPVRLSRRRCWRGLFLFRDVRERQSFHTLAISKLINNRKFAAEGLPFPRDGRFHSEIDDRLGGRARSNQIPREDARLFPLHHDTTVCLWPLQLGRKHADGPVR